MGIISNLLSGLAPLSSLLSSGSGSSLASGGSSSNAALQTLAQALEGTGAADGNSDGYLLDLSPQAQQLLNAGGSSGSGASSTSFTLNATQVTAINNILEKFKDAPQTQATFDEIQSALQAAGLSPKTLAAEDQFKSFNPTNVLLSALNGDYGNLQNQGTSASAEQTKEGNYLQSIVKAWQAMSTNSSGSGSTSAI